MKKYSLAGVTRAEFFILPFLTLVFLSAFSLLGAGEVDNRPNVLLITIDTLRADRLGCYGAQEAKTPVIDGLAARGVLFRQAFAHTPTTLPSHTNILLGTTPNYHGVHDNSNFRVGEEFLTLAEHLKAAGYATGAFVGAFPLDSRFGLTQGFDVYDDNYGAQTTQEFSYVERKAEVVVSAAAAWLEGRRGPWFLWIHCFDPHQKYESPEPFRTQYKDRPYLGEIAYVDFSLGRLFAVLSDKGLEKKTVVVFTADHGESLGEHGESTHGYFAYNATIRVPLIVSAPGFETAAVDGNVGHVDIFPTVCDLLGLAKPEFLQGVSLVPAMKGQAPAARPLYFESLYPFYSRGWAPVRGFVRGSEKYIDSPLPEYYDLKKDFAETNNIVSGIRRTDYQAQLEQLIKSQAGPSGMESKHRLDKATQEKLQSLGYISSPQAGKKKNFTAQDDLKTLLPFQNDLLKAMGAYHRGEIDEGIRLLRAVIAERKDFDLAYSYLATLYKEQRMMKEAVQILAEGLRNNPQSYKILMTYGLFLSEAGLFDQAIDVLRQSLAIIDFDPDAWNYLGMAYWSKGDYEEALKAYEKALSLDNNYAIVYNNLGSLFLSKALKAKDAEALRTAAGHFRRAIELDPKYASAYNGLGGALRQAGDLDGAIASWRKALELRPDFSYALYNLGLTHLAKGDKAQALSYFLTYKEKFYKGLPPAEKEKLDALIQKCRGS